jgi:hypothetical protein
MVVHDHFDGSAHCVDCDGPCELSGDELHVTRLVRYVLEFAEAPHHGWILDIALQAICDLAGRDRFLYLQRRAAQTNPFAKRA